MPEKSSLQQTLKVNPFLYKHFSTIIMNKFYQHKSLFTKEGNKVFISEGKDREATELNKNASYLKT